MEGGGIDGNACTPAPPPRKCIHARSYVLGRWWWRGEGHGGGTDQYVYRVTDAPGFPELQHCPEVHNLATLAHMHTLLGKRLNKYIVYTLLSPPPLNDNLVHNDLADHASALVGLAVVAV